MNPSDVVSLHRVRRQARDGAARALRIAAGVTLREIAEAVGVETATVWRWETGKRVPRGEPALAYARLLEALSDETTGAEEATSP